MMNCNVYKVTTYSILIAADSLMVLKYMQQNNNKLSTLNRSYLFVKKKKMHNITFGKTIV